MFYDRTMKPVKNVVGQRIAMARGRLKTLLTQLELSKRVKRLGVDIDRAGIAKIERGLRGVQDYEIVPLAKVLKVSVNWLLTGKGR